MLSTFRTLTSKSGSDRQKGGQCAKINADVPHASRRTERGRQRFIEME